MRASIGWWGKRKTKLFIVSLRLILIKSFTCFPLSWKMGQRLEPTSSLLFSLLALFLLFSSPAQALNIGIQSVPGGDGASKEQCSRTCESDHCSVAPFLRYGKYCGILYSGCPGEKPCDVLDACCMQHDNCVQAKNNDYLSTECNENLLNCLAKLSENSPTFQGNTCLMTEVIDVISVVIEAAVLAGRVLHKP